MQLSLPSWLTLNVSLAMGKILYEKCLGLLLQPWTLDSTDELFWGIFATQSSKASSLPSWVTLVDILFYRDKHTFLKLKENLPFCLRVSADIWNSPGKKKKSKKKWWVSLKMNLHFLQSSERKNISSPEVFISFSEIFGYEIWKNRRFLDDL